QILAFIEQSGLNGGGRAILETRGVEHFANGFAFFRVQGASGSGSRRRGPCRAEHRLAIEGSASHAERLTSRRDADGGRELIDGIHKSLSISSSVGSGHPNSVPSFFLNIDDDGGFAQFFGEAGILLLEFLHFLLDRIAFGFWTALLRRQRLADHCFALAPPCR